MHPSALTRLLSQHRLLALVIVFVAVLTSLGVGVLLGGRGVSALPPGDQPVPSATQAAEPSQTASPTSEDGSPTTMPEIPSQTPTTTPSPTSLPPSQPRPPTGWSLAGSFVVDASFSYMSGVVAWEGGFVAIGHRWFNQYESGDGQPMIWSSTDGRTWAEVAPDFRTTDVVLGGIAVLPNGRLMVVGAVGRPGSTESLRVAAWTSADAIGWSEVSIPFGPPPTDQVGFVGGPKGYLATIGDEVWFSDDGGSWTQTHDAGDGHVFGPSAGDEGFAVVVFPASGSTRLLASGDGVDWFEADRDGLYVAGPIGGDWLSWAHDFDTISLFRSPNALQWSPVLDVNELTGPDGPKAGLGMESGITEAAVVGSSELAVLTLGWNHCCVVPPIGVGVFTSADGESWTSAGLDEGAYVRGMATDGLVTVLVGHLDRGHRAAVWVGE
jgi:hypothetical protein